MQDSDVVSGNGMPIPKNRRWRDSKEGLSRMTDANHIAGNSKDGNTNLSFTDASISEEPSAGVPQAGICAGAVR